MKSKNNSTHSLSDAFEDGHLDHEDAMEIGNPTAPSIGTIPEKDLGLIQITHTTQSLIISTVKMDAMPMDTVNNIIQKQNEVSTIGAIIPNGLCLY